MNYQQILSDRTDHVLTITLNRPEKLNAWTATMEREVKAELLRATEDTDVRAIVITGAGRGFCAGADMSILEASTHSLTTQTEPVESRVETHAATGFDLNYTHRFSYLLRVPKPIFAAINGPVAGIGLCLTLYCDFRYMANDQKLTTAFAARGLIAEHGISWILPRLIGLSNALDLLYSARVILTDEAAALGLVNALPKSEFLPAVRLIAANLVQKSSPRSIGVIKRQVFDGLLQNIDEAWRAADHEMRKSFTSEDFREGVAHWMQKRAPHFTGR